MAYGSNILTNPSAETQDTTGWTITPVGSITVEENTTIGVEYIPIVDEREEWSSQKQSFMAVGAAGDYCFVFASDGDALMTQILYASDIGSQPVSFQLTCRFKFINQQDSWDNTVLGFAQLKIAYSDTTFDYFLIPFVKGVEHEDRYLYDFWVFVQNVCAVNADKTLTYVEVSARSSDCVNILHIDYIELRKET